jgi:hypothetical protein
MLLDPASFIKSSGEDMTRSLDLSVMAEVVAGETATAVVLTAELNDEAATGIVVSASVAGGDAINFRVHGGTDRKNYVLIFTITTSGGSTRIARLLMKVRDDIT